jgi:hypothetical protein
MKSRARLLLGEKLGALRRGKLGVFGGKILALIIRVSVFARRRNPLGVGRRLKHYSQSECSLS